jgi:ribonuclease III
MAQLADPERVALLEQRLGLPAGSLKPELALEALRHGSYVHERKLAGDTTRSNERLEFLGDSVLGLAVGLRCWDRFPGYAEGDLTRLRAQIVNADALAQVARTLALGELLLLGRGEERSGGREKQSLLADALEAVVAAVYLSCGLQCALEMLDRLLSPLFDAAATGNLGRDWKTELQQLMQGLHRAAPQYTVLDAPGPEHARTFEVEVSFQGAPIGRGTGRTKKEAEQAAARAAIQNGLPAKAAPGGSEPPPAEADAPQTD